MEKHDELLKEFEEKFSKIRKELNFAPTLDELDEVFFLRDFILQTGFVSPKLSRMVCSRIKDTLIIWTQQLQAWVTPNPYSFVSISESQIFSEEEKKEMNNITKEFLSLSSKNILVGLTKNKEKEKEFIEESLAAWKKNLPTLTKFTDKIQTYWQTKEGKEIKKQL